MQWWWALIPVAAVLLSAWLARTYRSRVVAERFDHSVDERRSDPPAP
jgi:hypothetical protein